MHVNVARSNERQSRTTGHLVERAQMRPIDGTREEFSGNPGTLGEGLGEPMRVVSSVGSRRRLHSPGTSPAWSDVWQEQRQAPTHVRLEIGTMQLVLALGRATSGARDPLAQLTIANTIGGEEHESHALLQTHFGADDELQRLAPTRHMGSHDTGHRTLVGQRQRAIAQGLSPFGQFLWVRSPTQKAEVRYAMQLGVIGQYTSLHAKTPCRNQCASMLRLR